ncbi:AAA family ATPase [Nocardia sp. NPDC059239]|uniref:AAA family ATPase n=1 Tax=Nocardia sp. NPDC059239 TaxID=3346785 RepID=UPI0036960864
MASGKRSAYDGCFTRTILDTFHSGVAARGDALLCADLVSEISKCVGQQQYLAYSGATLISGDPGLWLVPNAARSRDTVTGRPSAGFVDQLTAGVIITASVRESLTAIEEAGSARLRLVVGAAGSGKSTLLALFIRPNIARVLGVADNYIKAAAFLDASSTLETLAVELSAQLTVTVPGYDAARQAVAAVISTDTTHTTLSTWDRAVRLPLARCADSGRIHLIIDGLDQPQPAARELILAALQQLTLSAPETELGHIRVIAGVRSGTGIETRQELAHARSIEIVAPDLPQLARAATTAAGVAMPESLLAQSVGDIASGGWLIARLIREIADLTDELGEYLSLGELVAARAHLADSSGSSDGVRALSIIAAAGIGPLLPIRLLATMFGRDRTGVPLSRIRNLVVGYGALISRGNPGSDHETLGISHLALLDAIITYAGQRGSDQARAHLAIIEACKRFVDAEDPATTAADEQARTYWITAAPRHYIAGGDPAAAIEFLTRHETPRAADNRDRWAAWLPALSAALGEDALAVVSARHSLADCRGEAGDPRGAHSELTALLERATRVLSPDHPEVLEARQSLARWRGAAGDPAGAAAACDELLKDQLRVLDPDDPTVLITRREHAFWLGTAGHPSRAASEMENLLPDVRRVRGPDHPDTLTAEFFVAYWRGEAGDIAGAISALQHVVSDRTRVLGADDRNLRSARHFGVLDR